MQRNPRVTWIKHFADILEAQHAGVSVIPRIPREKYRKLSQQEQKAELKALIHPILDRCDFKYATGKNVHSFCHDDREPSMQFNREDHNFYCHACGNTWDIFDIVAAHFGLEGKPFPFQKAKVEELFVEPSIWGYRPALLDPEIAAKLRERGLTDESIVKFGLRAWNYYKDGAVSKYAAIPCAEGCMVHKKLVSGSDEHYDVYVKGGQTLTLFHEQRLSTAGKVVVVESALDAILLEQHGFPAVALNGVATKRLEAILEQQPVSPGLHLILLLDNDAAGRKATRTLHDLLKNFGVPFSRCDYDAPKSHPLSFLNGFKDVGEAFKANAGATVAAIRALVE